MPDNRVDGAALQAWRRSLGWDVPETARRLRRAAGDGSLPPHDALVRMIRRWERGDVGVSERYVLLYAKAIGIGPSKLSGPPQPDEGALSSGPRLEPPRMDLDVLRHVTAALEDARRYMDTEVTGYFSQRISDCAASDGASGPLRILPSVLGVVAAIERTARQVKPAVRRDLLAVGARGAEFAGFLYRDIRQPDMSAYWRDRATEWAQEGGHRALQGYVLLRKAQAAWDERDALPMVTLAQAAQDDIWRLPAGIRAEAAQQEARGYAMLGEDASHMERKLDEARELLADPGPPDGDSVLPGLQRNPSLFAMQQAICYDEAGQPARAVEIYEHDLTETAFSYRDYGYFLALKAGALAACGQWEQATEARTRALDIATETNSARTTVELRRVISRRV